MTTQQLNPYRNYHIYTHSSGGLYPPYTATFDFAEIRANGTVGTAQNVQCNGTYQTEEEAHVAANIAARRYIDALIDRN